MKEEEGEPSVKLESCGASASGGAETEEAHSIGCSETSSWATRSDSDDLKSLQCQHAISKGQDQRTTPIGSILPGCAIAVLESGLRTPLKTSSTSLLSICGNPEDKEKESSKY